MSSNVRTDCANSSMGWLDTRSGGHCAIGSIFLQWNCGNIKTGNAHPHAITNSKPRPANSFDVPGPSHNQTDYNDCQGSKADGRVVVANPEMMCNVEASLGYGPGIRQYSWRLYKER